MIQQQSFMYADRATKSINKKCSALCQITDALTLTVKHSKPNDYKALIEYKQFEGLMQQKSKC